MSFVYKSDSALSKDSSTSRNDFMDLNVKGTSLDYAGGSRPVSYTHLTLPTTSRV